MRHTVTEAVSTFIILKIPFHLDFRVNEASRWEVSLVFRDQTVLDSFPEAEHLPNGEFQILWDLFDKDRQENL